MRQRARRSLGEGYPVAPGGGLYIVSEWYVDTCAWRRLVYIGSEKSVTTSVVPILPTRFRKDVTCSDLRDHSVSTAKLNEGANKPPYVTSSRWIVAGHSLRRLPTDDMGLSGRQPASKAAGRASQN
jgi:hypothetical protein